MIFKINFIKGELIKKTIILFSVIFFSCFFLLSEKSFSFQKSSLRYDTSIGEVSNSYLKITIAPNGKFTIGTTGGDPDKNTDDEKKLLYGFPYPGSSVTKIKIDGTVNDINLDTGWSTSPSKTGNSLVCERSIQNISIKQELSFVEGYSSGRQDTVELKYTFVNNSAINHTIGLRILLDTMLGDNDWAPFWVLGKGEVTKDFECDNNPLTSAPDIPQAAQVFDTLLSPKVISLLTFSGIGFNDPDKVVFGYWGIAYSGNWDYPFDPNRSFIIYNNDGIPTSGDSVVLVFWEDKLLKPGEKISFAINYGLGALEYVSWQPFNIGLSSPAKLKVIKSSGTYTYIPKPFNVIAYIQNSSGAEVQNGKVFLNIPPEIKLFPGEVLEKNIEDVSGTRKLAKASTVQLAWQLYSDGRFTGRRNISVTAKYNNTTKGIGKNIYIPGFPNAVYGIITDKKSNALSGVKLSIYKNNEKLSETLSFNDGTYLFPDLETGDYRLQITCEGYLDVWSDATAFVTEDKASAISIIMHSKTEFNAMKSYPWPNPVSGNEARISFFPDSDGNAMLYIYNVRNELVCNKTIETISGTENQFVWNINDVSNGLYFYKIILGTKNSSGKIVILNGNIKK